MAESRTNGGGSQGTLSVHPAPPTAPIEALTKGDALGRYLILEQLGAGAMGVVYAAYDPELDRKIAIKVLRPQEGKGDRARRQERLVREAKAMAKLSHPNVGAIYDVGVHGDQVFLAMEFLSGGTLRDWVTAKKHPWREVVRMFIEVGKGLAGAHAEGLIHRDFKPDNVLLDKNGVPKVVDFGLVRLTRDTLEQSSVDLTATAEEEEAALPVAETALAALTRTGALTGTPAYMASEQFLGKAIDERSDQFAFCVALYEALYGERPFAGDSVLAIADAVTEERIRTAPKSSDIPTWVRRCVHRGLHAAPAQRYPSIDDLLSALANDPVVRLRRRILVAATSVTVVAGAVAIRQAVVSKRHEIEKKVAEYVSVAAPLLAEADAKRIESKGLRERALEAFDHYQRDKGESLWAESLAAATTADADYLKGIQHLEAAATLVPRRDLKDRIADALVAYAEMDGRSRADRETTLRHMAGYDEGGDRTRRLNAPARLRIETTAPGLAAQIEEYDLSTHRAAKASRPAGRTPIDLTLPAGSYRVTFADSGDYAGFRYPVLLQAGEIHAASLHVPKRSSLPKDFVYVPEGASLFGSDDEEIRAIFFETTPLHAVKTEAFLISRYETTIGDWLAYLDSLPEREREARRPHGGRDALGGFVDVRKSASSQDWEIRFRATDKNYHATRSESFHYQDRDRRATLDWARFPVTGISPQDGAAYATWLNRSGRIPGARLCTEREWERAARGADSRRFPHGDTLLADDANFDLTYGRQNGAYGPDEVGSHEASVSPFGVYDLVGNAWDITRSVLDRDQYVARGSSFYLCLKTLVSANRDPISAVTRDYTIGLRICADPSW